MKILETATCLECGDAYDVRRSDQAYCSVRCGQLAAQREQTRSRRLYRALYYWRLPTERRNDPGGLAANLKFICREIRAWHAEDLAASRPGPPKHNHESDRGHQRGEPGKGKRQGRPRKAAG